MGEFHEFHQWWKNQYISRDISNNNEFVVYPKSAYPYLCLFYPCLVFDKKEEYRQLKKRYKKQFYDEKRLFDVHNMMKPIDCYQLKKENKTKELESYMTKLIYSKQIILLRDTRLFFHFIEFETLD